MFLNYSKIKIFIFATLITSAFAGTNVEKVLSEDFDCYNKNRKIPARDILKPENPSDPRTPSVRPDDPLIARFLPQVDPNTLVNYSFTCGVVTTMIQDTTGKERPDGPSKEVGKSIAESIEQIFFKIAYDSVATKKELGFCTIDINFRERVFGKYSLSKNKLENGTIPMGYEACTKYGGTYYPVLNAKVHPKTVNGKNVVEMGYNFWATENESKKTPNSRCSGNKNDNCKKYGALYNWQEAGTVCPSGFIIPSASDYLELTEAFTNRATYKVSMEPALSQEFRSPGASSIGLDFPLSGDMSLFTRDAESVCIRKAARGQRALFKNEIPLDEGDVIVKDYGDSALIQRERDFGEIAYFRTDSGYVELTKDGFKKPSSVSLSQMMHTRCIQDPATITNTIDTVPAYTTGTMKDPRDGKTYKTIHVDDMHWMAENLNYKVGNSVCYDKKEGNCKKYGRLYTWKDAEHACPEGWRLPAPSQYAYMAAIINGSVFDGILAILRNKLSFEANKNTTGKGFRSTSKDWINGGAGTDDLGFNALPAGTYFEQTGFVEIGKSTAFWTSGNDKKTNKHQTVVLKGSDDIIYLGIQSPDNTALSIRCIEGTTKDDKEPSAQQAQSAQQAPSGSKNSQPAAQGSFIRLPIVKSIRVESKGSADYMDREKFVEFLKEQRMPIEKNFQNFVNAKGETSTSIKFRITINSKTGTVTNVEDVSRDDFKKEPRHTLLFKKMAMVFSKWKFQKDQKGDSVYVEFPIKFETR